MATDKMTAEQAGRLSRITDRILDRLDVPERMKITSRDGKLNNLFKQFHAAEEKNNYFSMTIIRRQMSARTDDLLCDYAAKRINELITNGEIITYMDEDQKDLFDALRGRMFLLMDALDTAFMDMTMLLEQNGIPGNVKMLEQIGTARKAIDAWCKETVPVMRSEVSGLACDESDKLYEYVSDRAMVLDRKVRRWFGKKVKEIEKAKEKAQSNLAVSDKK